MDKAVLEVKKKDLAQLKAEFDAAQRDAKAHYEAYLNLNGVIQYTMTKYNKLASEIEEAEKVKEKPKK